ncbi:MAG: hypothetical protein JJE51_12055 [Thermoanaerobaculia bacterium]|nr:hypothetical protein [Thermoanaerobaculia bacterium]
MVGAAVVYYFGIRQIVAQRRSGFLERQLAEFYAPLAGIRKQIRAKSELRLRISNAAESAWHDICRSYGERIMHDHEERFAPFKKIIEYNNEQLKSDLVPMYREMLKIFTERYHLAEPETRDFYSEFLEFVEIWNRSLADALPGEVVEKLGHSEDRVKPFYDHLESRVTTLQQEILDRTSRALGVRKSISAG